MNLRDETSVVIASMETFNDPDTATVRIDLYHEWTPPDRLVPGTYRIEGWEAEIPIEPRFAGVRGFQIDPDPIKIFRPMVKIEEEQSDDDEVEHGQEIVGHIAFDPGTIEDIDGNEIGVAGFLPISGTDEDTWIRLPIDHRSFPVDESVAFVQVLSFDGPHPVHPRIATSHPFTEMPGFHFRMEEWPTYDGRHGPELLGYVVLKEGFHAIPPPRHERRAHSYLEVGTTDPFNYLVAEDNWEFVALDESLSPTSYVNVVTQCQTFNGREPVVTRQQYLSPPGPSSHGFQVRLQEAERHGNHPAEEVVGYVAFVISRG
jgi:hypothetical protein